jgi:aminodeoxyfutalosine synthase
MARGWGEVAEVARSLREAGLDALAEAPIDRVSPDDVAEAAGAGLAPEVLSVQEHAEGSEACVAMILQMRAFTARVPAITRVAPLAREQSVTVPTTGYQDVRMVALTRLGLPGIPEIEVDWQQYGPKLSQVALMFGASHLDRVSPVDDAALGPRRASAEEVRRNIVAAGYRPADPGEAA